jgi:hypothetical protein
MERGFGDAAHVESAIREALRPLVIVGKTGESLLKGRVADALNAAGLFADVEDSRQFLRDRMRAWRSRETGRVEQTSGRLRLDVVVYRGEVPVALVETESDLNHLTREGATKQGIRYDVHSIARSRGGRFFYSYKSLERMAAAALYRHRFTLTGAYPSPEEGEALLEAVASDRPEDHNPASLALFLVSGRCRGGDPALLEPRLRSLGAKLICGGTR